MPNRVLTPVTELDFDGIKQNLKNYLSSNGDFTDFDYEGSAMNILLDILAYNTHYTAMYANMVAAESFMDSAVLRRSVVSLAKNLGHVPSSRTAATAKLSLSFGQTAGVPSTLPKGTKFYASKDGSSYTFSTVEPFAIDRTAEPYTCENFTIRQGVYTSQTFLYDVNSNSTKFEIVSTKLDKSLLEVYILSSPSDLTNMDIGWKENSDYLSLDSTSKVYFINENYRGNYEVSFGDGILGQKPENGNYILVVYFESEGDAANDIGILADSGVSAFSFGGIGGNDFDATVTTIDQSYGGAERDSTEKIRYTAPKYYQSNDRTVTLNDYESIILREFPLAEAVRVWGGEENDPPAYGKVFISILPKNAQVLSDAEKESLISTVLDRKKIVTVTPELVDPDYTFVLVECFGTYDSSKSITTEKDVRQTISTAIRNYSILYLQKFNQPFRYSVLTRQIDLSTNSLVGNRISTRLLKKLIPIENPKNYSMDFGISLFHPYDGYNSVLQTSLFGYADASGVVRNCFMEDDGYGNISMYSVINGQRTLIKDSVGSIDYSSGKVNLIDFFPSNTGQFTFIKIIVTPDQRFDIVPKRNQILTVDGTIAESINITLNDAAVRNI